MKERLSLDMAAICKNIKDAKILIVHGTQDAIMNHTESDKYHNILPDIKLVKVENADHDYSKTEYRN